MSVCFSVFISLQVLSIFNIKFYSCFFSNKSVCMYIYSWLLSCEVEFMTNGIYVYISFNHSCISFQHRHNPIIQQYVSITSITVNSNELQMQFPIACMGMTCFPILGGCFMIQTSFPKVSIACLIRIIKIMCEVTK